MRLFGRALFLLDLVVFLLLACLAHSQALAHEPMVAPLLSSLDFHFFIFLQALMESLDKFLPNWPKLHMVVPLAMGIIFPQLVL